ncbi:hypothetical protein [Nocardia sp. N2S4-5]|uniref:hypothetical protein n=1 Tax=Nocardia sp. N2S4-5 TaxID=3351565 RepID=UPI0037D0D348
MVIEHDDERYDAKVRALTADRAVVLTTGTAPCMEFAHALLIGEFDGLLTETARHQQRITQAVAEYASRTHNRNLVSPNFPAAPKFAIDKRDEPAYRAWSTANYIADVWSAWILTDEQRVRRTIEPRTGSSPWIMPEELGEPNLAMFPSEFAKRLRPEPVA